MAIKSLYTKKLGSDVARSARPLNPRKFHVISGTANGWTVVLEGTVRSVRVFSSKRQAIRFARQSAIRINGEVVIHERTGQIRELLTFEK